MRRPISLPEEPRQGLHAWHWSSPRTLSLEDVLPFPSLRLPSGPSLLEDAAADATILAVHD
eukprot:1363151-Prorocentrum_lima.AAC.1